MKYKKRPYTKTVQGLKYFIPLDDRLNSRFCEKTKMGLVRDHSTNLILHYTPWHKTFNFIICRISMHNIL